MKDEDFQLDSAESKNTLLSNMFTGTGLFIGFFLSVSCTMYRVPCTMCRVPCDAPCPTQTGVDHVDRLYTWSPVCPCCHSICIVHSVSSDP